MLEKMGFLDKKNRNDEYKPIINMPNVRNFNNLAKNSFYKPPPKNMILDKVFLLFSFC